ncbi:hypothetical protein EGW08_017480, partial [Elysia chlorotica]
GNLLYKGQCWRPNHQQLHPSHILPEAARPPHTPPTTMQTIYALAALAVLALTVSASPCTDICNGQCALQSAACEFSGIFGNLCATQSAICGQTCAAACNCADTCATQCGGSYATCKGDGSDILNVANCGLNLSVCSATCHAQCQFNTFAGIINALTGGA